jgi:seryl-tRNA synthetase
VHEFEKVEQFIYCAPGADSARHLEDMLKTSEQFYQALKLPYRVVEIVSDALNNAASKKYDLEAWFPFKRSGRSWSVRVTALITRRGSWR